MELERGGGILKSGAGFEEAGEGEGVRTEVGGVGSRVSKEGFLVAPVGDELAESLPRRHGGCGELARHGDCIGSGAEEEPKDLTAHALMSRQIGRAHV